LERSRNLFREGKSSSEPERRRIPQLPHAKVQQRHSVSAGARLSLAHKRGGSSPPVLGEIVRSGSSGSLPNSHQKPLINVKDLVRRAVSKGAASEGNTSFTSSASSSYSGVISPTADSAPASSSWKRGHPPQQATSSATPPSKLHVFSRDLTDSSASMLAQAEVQSPQQQQNNNNDLDDSIKKTRYIVRLEDLEKYDLISD
jgi:hypothetical protein